MADGNTSPSSPEGPLTEEDEEQVKGLSERIEEQKKRETQFRVLRTVCVATGFVASAVTIFSGLIWVFVIRSGTADPIFYVFAISLYVTISLFAISASLPVQITAYQVTELQDELDLRQMRYASHEQKAFKLLKIQQSQLTRYLSVILAQSKLIFFVGIFAMGVGVAVVFYAIAESKTANGSTEKVIVGILGAVGAILTNFVSAIYLKMFTDIGSAVKQSVGTLSQSTNLNFAHVLLAKINAPDMRNTAYRDLAMKAVEVRPAESKGPSS